MKQTDSSEAIIHNGIMFMIIDAHLHLWNKVDGNIGEPVHALGNGIISIGESTIVSIT